MTILFPAKVLLAAAATTSLAAQDLVAIKAGKILTMRGEPLSNAVVVCENGRIKEVGAGVEVPWNATVVDASDKVVMPTWVLAHTTGGLSGTNERMANVPFLTVADGIDPSSSFFEEALRNGIGTIHVIPGNSTLVGGVGMVVRPYGATVEDMAIRDRAGIKLSLAATGGALVAQIRKLRRALEDAAADKAELERKRDEFEREKAAGATDAESFDEELEPGKQAVVDLIEGKLRGYLYVPNAVAVAEAGRLEKAWPELDLVLVVDRECYKAAPRVASIGFPVVLDADAIEFWETDPITEEESLVSPAKALTTAGVPLVLTTSPSSTAASRYPWWQIATAIRNGVDRASALRAMTTEPAELLGLGDELGTIEPGKAANLQILTGDPLAATTWVETVLLDGEIVYERSADLRLRHLFGTDH